MHWIKSVLFVLFLLVSPLPAVPFGYLFEVSLLLEFSLRPYFESSANRLLGAAYSPTLESACLLSFTPQICSKHLRLLLHKSTKLKSVKLLFTMIFRCLRFSSHLFHIYCPLQVPRAHLHCIQWTRCITPLRHFALLFSLLSERPISS
jgi:hypothetical protein